jgi:hypothetical protein
MNDNDILRRVRFSPYRKGKGPIFSLTIWDTGQRDGRGRTYIGYRLKMGKTVLFEGEDFAGSPMHGDDSDDNVKALMSFLTLKPGDTDAEYFEQYTEEQLAYCRQHADSLNMEVLARFGWDD